MPNLTNQQKTTLKAYILADPVLGPLTSGESTDFGAISDALSAKASPTVLAWKTSVSPADADDAPSYAAFDSIAAGKRESWGFFLRFSRDFTRKKVRDWIVDVWGNATAGTNAEAILLAGTENATRAEVALGGTSRTTGAVTALVRNYIGGITIEDVGSMFLPQRVAG